MDTFRQVLHDFLAGYLYFFMQNTFMFESTRGTFCSTQSGSTYIMKVF